MKNVMMGKTKSHRHNLFLVEGVLAHPVPEVLSMVTHMVAVCKWSLVTFATVKPLGFCISVTVSNRLLLVSL